MSDEFLQTIDGLLRAGHSPFCLVFLASNMQPWNQAVLYSEVEAQPPGLYTAAV